MSEKKRVKQLGWKPFVSGLRELVESLPSEDEKKRIDEALTTIVEFIMDVQARLGGIPTRESATAVDDALRQLEDVIIRAKGSAPLASALGIKVARPMKVGDSFTQEDRAEAERLLAVLRTLPIDALRARLEDEGLHSSRQLRSIAALLGIRVTAKTSREAVIQSIATKISNYRGYEHLRGEPEDVLDVDKEGPGSC